MALGFSTEVSSGGKFLPVVKFDAKSGDMICVNREPVGDGTWEKNEVEVSLPTKTVMDLANIEVGWISFAPTYSAAMVPAGEKFPAKPSEDHKQAVRLKVFFKEHGLREFTPTSKTVNRALDELHNKFIEQAPAHPGKMPVVTIEGVETIKVSTPQGELRFKAPKMSITGWIDPPAAFAGEAEALKPAAKAAPKKQPEPVEAEDSIDEF